MQSRGPALPPPTRLQESERWTYGCAQASESLAKKMAVAEEFGIAADEVQVNGDAAVVVL
jgi:hypothetical protein